MRRTTALVTCSAMMAALLMLGACGDVGGEGPDDQYTGIEQDGERSISRKRRLKKFVKKVVDKGKDIVDKGKDIVDDFIGRCDKVGGLATCGKACVRSRDLASCAKTVDLLIKISKTDDRLTMPVPSGGFQYTSRTEFAEMYEEGGYSYPNARAWLLVRRIQRTFWRSRPETQEEIWMEEAAEFDRVGQLGDVLLVGNLAAAALVALAELDIDV